MQSVSFPTVRTALGGLAVTALVTASLTTTTTPAAAAPGDDAACPAAFPAEELTPGLEVTGLTTSGVHRNSGSYEDHSTTPETFTGHYLSTLEDPTGDLFVFELEGSRITKPDGSVDAGIWSGISGSPLYAADGRLIGSVSYSFGFMESSVYAGVTPAADLYALLDETAPAPAARIRPDDGERRALVAEGMPATTASTGAVRLSTPTQVAGLTSTRVPLSSRTLSAIAARSGMATPRAGGGTGTQGVNIPIVPGGNVAVADSYGSVALFSVGTAAAVCDDVVIGYGHSADWTPLTRSVHGASTAFIQADGAASSKFVNLAAPEGTLLTDRLAGITGRLGAAPEGITVDVTSNGPRPRATESTVNSSQALSYVVATQAYRDAALTLDEMGKGGAVLSWTISYLRADGTPATFTRSQRYASRFSIADEVTTDVSGDIDALLNNGFEDITITGVDVTQELTRTYRAYDLAAIEIAQNGRWRRIADEGLVSIRPGAVLKARLTLRPSQGTSGLTPLRKVVSFTTNRSATGIGALFVEAHGASFWDDEEFDGMPVPEARTFGEFLRLLGSTPRQDRIDISLFTPRRGAPPRIQRASWNAGAVAHGTRYIGVRHPRR